MTGVRLLVVLVGSLLWTGAFAQATRVAPDPPTRAGPADAQVDAAEFGDDAAAWLRRMVVSERAFAFAVAPDERSSLPAVEARGGFAWPAGATLEAVRSNFDVRWVGRERSGERTIAVIELVPRHDAPAWRFWIDVATGARVAYRATLRDGSVVAEGRGDAALLVRAVGGEPLPAPRAPDDLRAAEWRDAFGGLDGFEPVAVSRLLLADGVPALRVTLWDGLTGVVLLAYPAARAVPRGDLLTTRSNRNLTLALVGPVSGASAAAYLEDLSERRWARANLDTLLRRWAPDAGGRAEDAGPAD